MVALRGTAVLLYHDINITMVRQETPTFAPLLPLATGYIYD